jgi:hypothetical protein
LPRTPEGFYYPNPGNGIRQNPLSFVRLVEIHQSRRNA